MSIGVKQVFKKTTDILPQMHRFFFSKQLRLKNINYTIEIEFLIRINTNLRICGVFCRLMIECLFEINQYSKKLLIYFATDAQIFFLEIAVLKEFKLYY